MAAGDGRCLSPTSTNLSPSGQYRVLYGVPLLGSHRPDTLMGRGRSDAWHRADCALEGQNYKLDVLADIDKAEIAIAKLDRISGQYRRSFVAHVLFKRRPS